MNNTINNLINLLELPGMSNMIKYYQIPSVKTDRKYLNRTQLKDYNNVIYI